MFWTLPCLLLCGEPAQPMPNPLPMPPAETAAQAATLRLSRYFDEKPHADQAHGVCIARMGGKALVVAPAHLYDNDNGGDTVKVLGERLADGRSWSLKLLAADRTDDIAAFEIAGDESRLPQPVPLADAAPAFQAELWIRAPRHLRRTWVRSLGLRDSGVGGQDLQLTYAADPGDSGTGVFTKDGALAGLVVARVNKMRGPDGKTLVPVPADAPISLAAGAPAIRRFLKSKCPEWTLPGR